VFWTLVFPIGIPLAFTLLLYKARVPELAMWKRDCAWLRNIAQRAIVLSVMTTAELDSDSVTTDSVTIEQLRLLHRLFVLCDPAAEAEQSMPAGALALTATVNGSDVPPVTGGELALTDGAVKGLLPAQAMSRRRQRGASRKRRRPRCQAIPCWRCLHS
jgi:hypothetical protein